MWMGLIAWLYCVHHLLYCALQVQLVPNLQNSGAASLRLLSDASLDPDISQEESGSDGEELDSESSGTDVDGDIPTV